MTGEADAPRPGRVIVLADVGARGPEVRLEVMERATTGGVEVLVVAPAIVDRWHFWASDVDAARVEAESRVEESIGALAFRGSHWRGLVGDEDPLQAIDDALREFPADEIIVVTAERDAASWIEDGLIAQVEARYPLPVTHFISSGDGAARSAHRVPAPDGRRTRAWRWAVFAGFVALAVLGTWASFLFADAGMPRWALVSWVIVLDVGFKIVALPLAAWWLFFRRPRGDRLDL